MAAELGLPDRLVRSWLRSADGRPAEASDAPMESFFATLKRELFEEADYQTRDQARADVFHSIEGFYTRGRLHSALGYLTPVQKAAAFHPAASAA